MLLFLSKTAAQKINRHRYNESIVGHRYLDCPILVRGRPELLEGRHYEVVDLEVEDYILGRKTRRRTKRFFHVLGEEEPAGTVCATCESRHQKEGT
jgi:hypothetical protein